ncbi:Uncharacterised protein [Salmonella enterica subsp. enterica serovar Bovismorbificans]|uniref:Uncharacterized protein n=1 Tax=Salmonella enterica subsp. enterica serovar Bovismorbificans TaxID=58097 RepID=A0A655CH40_SALET|nr:Uncharacterised protein [Salmonella enterica subsp. enterica serovar Bovismorbificans]
MGKANHRPVNDQRGDHQRHQQSECGLWGQVVEQHAQRRHDGGNQNGAHRHAAFVDVQQRFRRISLLGQTEQHTAVAVNAAVINR